MWKVNFRNKVRFYTSLLLIISGVTIIFYTSILNVDDRTTVDKFYGNEAKTLIESLKNTEWGNSSRGRKILSAFREEEIRVVTPTEIRINSSSHYTYDNGILSGPAEGMMSVEKGVFRIHISLYNKYDDSSIPNGKTIEFMDFSISEDEFIHILVDELLSRHQRGYFFVEGEASEQEEMDAWLAAEEAVKAYYRNENYSVIGLSNSSPRYGPDNRLYIKVR